MIAVLRPLTTKNVALAGFLIARGFEVDELVVYPSRFSFHFPDPEVRKAALRYGVQHKAPEGLDIEAALRLVSERLDAGTALFREEP